MPLTVRVCAAAGAILITTVTARAQVVTDEVKKVDEEVKAESKDVAKTATSTVPQVPAIRDGTLGIPSSGVTSGVQAAVETDSDAFAKLGGLGFGSRFSAEFLAERFQSDVPRVVLDRTPVLPAIIATDTSAVGFRLRIRLRQAAWRVVYSGSGAACKLEVKTGAEPAPAPPPGGPAVAVVPAAPALPCAADSEQRVAAEVSARTASRTSGWTLSTGLRYLTRTSTEEDGEGSKGVAGELSVQYGLESSSNDPDNNLGFSGFLSLSGIQMYRAEDRLDSIRTIFPAVTSTRLTVGAEMHLNLVTDGGSPVLPRVGVYGTVARNHWTNEFAMGTSERDISGRELQAAIYFSGHFFAGFQGLVSFGMLQTYGATADERQWIVNVTPSVGAPVGGKDDKK